MNKELERVNNELFEYYFGALVKYARAKKHDEMMFYMGGAEHILGIYSAVNNISNEEAKTILSAMVAERVEANK